MRKLFLFLSGLLFALLHVACPGGRNSGPGGLAKGGTSDAVFGLIEGLASSNKTLYVAAKGSDGNSNIHKVKMRNDSQAGSIDTGFAAAVYSPTIASLADGSVVLVSPENKRKVVKLSQSGGIASGYDQNSRFNQVVTALTPSSSETFLAAGFDITCYLVLNEENPAPSISVIESTAAFSSDQVLVPPLFESCGQNPDSPTPNAQPPVILAVARDQVAPGNGGKTWSVQRDQSGVTAVNFIQNQNQTRLGTIDGMAVTGVAFRADGGEGSLYIVGNDTHGNGVLRRYSASSSGLSFEERDFPGEPLIGATAHENSVYIASGNRVYFVADTKMTLSGVTLE